MILKCINNDNVASAYMQIITPGISEAYFLVAIKFKEDLMGEGGYYKYKFYNPSDSYLGKTKPGKFKLTLSGSNFVININESYFETGSTNDWDDFILYNSRSGDKDGGLKYIFSVSGVVDKYGNTVNTNSNTYNAYPQTSPKSNSGSSTDNYKRRVTCSYCTGKGWVPGNSTPSYGSSTKSYCNECEKMVIPSHSHDRCSSCMGRGYIEKSR